MIRSILVPLDGSLFASRAFPLALGLAKYHAASLALATVYHPLLPSRTQGASPIDPSYDNDQRASLLEHLDRLAFQASQVGCRDPQPFVLEGVVVDCLEAFIRDHHIDLVVMSTHGRGGFSRAWLGSVAEGLLRRVAVPLLLTRFKHKMPTRRQRLFPFTRALVALDGSPSSERAIDEVIRLCGDAPVHLTLAHVVAPTQTLLSPLLTSQFEEDVRRSYLEPLAARLLTEGRSVSVEVVVHGHTARALVGLAKRDGADLIAVSSSGVGGLPRFLMGSVVDKVIRSSLLPVLVHVPAGVEDKSA